MEMKQERTRSQSTTSTTGTVPVCVSVRSSHGASKGCLTAIENLLLSYPTVKVALEAVRDLDGRVIEFVLAAQPPKNVRWDKPTPQLTALYYFVQDVMSLFAYLPTLTARPDEAERAVAAGFAHHLSPAFTANAA